MVKHRKLNIWSLINLVRLFCSHLTRRSKRFCLMFWEAMFIAQKEIQITYTTSHLVQKINFCKFGISMNQIKPSQNGWHAIFRMTIWIWKFLCGTQTWPGWVEVMPTAWQQWQPMEMFVSTTREALENQLSMSRFLEQEKITKTDINWRICIWARSCKVRPMKITFT